MKKDSFSKSWHIRLLTLILCVMMLTVGCGTKQSTQSSSPEKKPSKEYILIGWVAPFTGPLAQFTQSVKFIEEKALAVINKDGGIYIKEYDKKLPVKIIWADSESNPTKASEAASKLVLSDKVDFLVGSWTPDTINPVSAVAERNKIPALMENGPMESWMEGGPYQWAFGNVFSVDNMAESYLDAWDTVPTNKKVGFIFDNNVDGVQFSALTKTKAEARGYKIVDPGRFPAGTKDYTSMINIFKKEGVDIIIANMITPDFANAWKQFQQQGFIPKIFLIGKAMHFTSDITALGGDLGNGLLSEDLWSRTFPYKSPLTGQTSEEISAEWEKASGKPADCTIGYDWSTFEIINDVFTRAQTVDREKVREALAATDLDTSYGHIKYVNQISEVPLAVSQWVKRQDGTWGKNVVSNRKYPEIPLSKDKSSLCQVQDR